MSWIPAFLWVCLEVSVALALVSFIITLVGLVVIAMLEAWKWFRLGRMK